MAGLITLQAAKEHLRVEHNEDDIPIQRYADEASAIVLDYIKKRIGTPDPADPSIVDWDETSVPLPVRAAIELMLSKLYDDRNAGQENDERVALGYLTPAITALLHRYRDPALA